MTLAFSEREAANNSRPAAESERAIRADMIGSVVGSVVCMAGLFVLLRAFFLAAGLLLFLEGLIASAFAMGKPEGRKAG